MFQFKVSLLCDYPHNSYWLGNRVFSIISFLNLLPEGSSLIFSLLQKCSHGHIYQVQKKLRTSGYLWYLLAYRSACWPPGSLSIASTCYRAHAGALAPLSFSHPVPYPNFLQLMDFHFSIFSFLYTLLGAEHEDLCTHRSPEKPGMLSTQDCLSNGKDEKPVLPSRKLRTGD